MPNKEITRSSLDKTPKNFVLLADTPGKSRLDSFTTAEYLAIPINERQRRVKTTLEYLRSIPQIQRNDFTNADGTDVDAITIDSLIGISASINKTLSPVRPSKIIKNIPRMPTEVVTHWIYALQSKLDQITKSQDNRKKLTGNTSLLEQALDNDLVSREQTIRKILEKKKSRWLSHDLKISTIKQALKEDSVALRQAGFSDLADLAYRADGKPSLFQQLPLTEIFENNQARLNDNMYGRTFETAFINSLVEQPPKNLFVTMGAIAKGLNDMLDELPPTVLEEVLIPRLDQALRNNQRFWFQYVPKMAEFLNTRKTNQEKLTILRNILHAEIKSSYQIIGIVYLVQKLYIARYGLRKYISVDNLQWMLTTQSIYDQIDPIKSNSNKNTTIYQLLSRHLPGSKKKFSLAAVPGITNLHQPALTSTFEAGPIDRPSTSKVVNFDQKKMPSVVKDALTYGIPHASGISGTTNIFLGTLTHLKTDLGYEINPQEALLGLLMFLNFDGGHSIHEALWMVNYRESQAKEKKYISLGLGKAAAERKSVKEKNIYISDYEKLLSYYKNTEVGVHLAVAEKSAWDTTLAYFKEHSAYKTGLDNVIAPPPTTKQVLARLEEIISAQTPSKKNWQQLTKELEIIVQKKSEAYNVSKAKAAYDFALSLNIFSLSKLTDFHEKILFSLASIAIKEEQEDRLWEELKNHPEFKDFKKENLWRLTTTDREENNIYSYADDPFYMQSMYAAFRKMLKHRNKIFTTVHLLELHNIFVRHHIVEVNIGTTYLLTNKYDHTENLGFSEKAYQRDLIIKKPGNKLSCNATLNGVKEMIEKSLADNKQHFEIKDYQFDINGDLIADIDGKVATLVVPARKAKNVQADAEKVIIRYHVELARATTAEQKLTAIARVCRDLASLHIFKTGTQQVISILIMNKLLLQNGFSPVVLESSEHVEGFSVNELTDNIKLGQISFARAAQHKETPVDRQRHTSIEDDPSTSWQELEDIHEEVEKKGEDPAATAIEKETDAARDIAYAQAYQERYADLEDRLLDENEAAFRQGYDVLSYQKVPIPNYEEGMSLLEMQALAVDGELDLKTLGALMRRIMLKQIPEIDATQVLKTLTDTHTAFEDLAGFVYKRPVSQTLYTMTVDNLSPGLCYGLTWIMATALASQGESAADRFAKRLYETAEYPRARAAVLTQTAINAIHHYANSAYKKKIGDAAVAKKYTLAEIAAHIETITDTQMYEMNTSKHTMMVGVIKRDTGYRFYFYDPNIGIAAYSSSVELHTALNRYFNEERLSEYQSLTPTENENTATLPQFEFERIDTQAVAKLKFELPFNETKFPNAALTTEDLFSSDNLRKSLIRRQKIEAQTARLSLDSAINTVNTNPTLERCLSSLDSQHLAKNYLKSAANLYSKNQLSHDWMPLLSKIETSTTGYRIPFINRHQPQSELTWLNTADDVFFKTKQYIEQRSQQINESHALTDSLTLNKKPHVSEVVGIDGMNAGFAVQQLITWVQQSNREAHASPEMSKNLATALSIHSYVSLTQIAQGTSHDITEVVSIVRTFIAQSKEVEVIPASSVFAQTLSHSMQSIGALLGGCAVVLDAYEFTHAENATQRAVFGTQLAFDAASLAMSVAGIGAGLAGATTAAGILGPIGVVVAGIGVGASGLAQAYGEVAEDTKAVAAYFAAVLRAYEIGCQYNAEQKQLSFCLGSVISHINLDSGLITYDSQYLYPSDYGLLGYADASQDNENREQAIVVRTALDCAQTLSINEQARHADVVILPSTLKSYIGHYREKLLGVRKSEGSEYEALHRLEQSSAGRFKFEYFFFPFASTIRSITQTYLPTNIAITLGRRDRTLLVPQLPQPTSIRHPDFHYTQSMTNQITYSLCGQGGLYVIVLNQGATIYLDTPSATETTLSSRWILDSRSLSRDDITFVDNKMMIDGVTIIVQSKQTNKVLLLKRDGELCDVDLVNQQFTVSSEDASQWQTSHQQSLEAHLQDLNKHHQLSGEYTAIDHYKHNQINVGRAYYHNKLDRIFFSQIVPFDVTTLDQLIDMIKAIQSEPLVSALKEIYTHEIFNTRMHQQNYHVSTSKTSIRLNKLEECKKLISILQSNESIAAPEFKSLIIELKKLVAAEGIVLQEYELTPDAKIKRLRTKLSATENASFQNKMVESRAGMTSTLPGLTDEINRWQTQLNKLKQLYTISTQAELIGVIGNDAYFYHAEQKMLWRTNCTTNAIEAHFINPLNNEGQRRFWLESNAIYMACTTALDDSDKGELIYRIDAQTMTLVAVNFFDAAKDGSGLIDFFGNHIFYAVSIGARTFVNPVPTPTIAFSSQVTTIKVSYVPFVTIAGKDRHGVMQHYWLESSGKILKPNLPPSESIAATAAQQDNPTTVASSFPSDLVLAIKIPRPKNQTKIKDIFYFYSHAQQALYRQEGYGVTEVGASWPYDTVDYATRLATPQLIDILRVDENLFFLTADGLVQRVDQTGYLALTAVNKIWLTKQGNNWWQALKALPNKEQTLTIIGITAADKKTILPAWYYANQLVVSALSSTKLELLNVDPLGQYAHLFDPVQKKLYRQPLLTEAQLTSAFGDDFSLTSASNISAATDLFPTYHFQSATVVAGTLRLVTSDGVILNMDQNGHAHLMGVNKSWQAAHAGAALLPDIEKLVLTEAWKHGETLVLQGSVIPTWYHIGTKKIIQATDLTASDQPIFIGIDPHHAEAYVAYIYSPKKGLYQYYSDNQGTTIKPMLLTVNHAERIDDTLLLRGTDGHDILQPIALENVDTLVMCGGEGEDVYQIDVEDRERYKVIAINNFDQNEAQDALQLTVNDIREMMIKHENNDVLFVDSHGTVVIKDASDPEQSHLNIIFSDKKQNRYEQTLSDLLNAMSDNTAHLIQNMATFDKQTSSEQITSSTYQTAPHSNALQIGPSMV